MEKRYCLDQKKLNIIGLPITTKCNLKCEHCLRQVKNEYTNRDWDMSLVEAINVLKKISKKTKYVNLSAGYGETLLHNEVEDIVNVFRSGGIKTIIYSNCTRAVWGKLERLETDVFIYSADLYHHINISHFKDNVKKFINYVRQLKYIFTDKFIISCTIEPDNQSREVVEFLVDMCENDTNIFLEFHWRMFYGEKNEVSDKVFEFMQWMDNLVLNERIRIPMLENKTENVCRDIFNSLYFDYNGNVRKCCIFMESDPRCNIYKMNVDEILNSTLLNNWQREWLDEGEFEFCRNCPIGHGFVR